MLLGALLFSMLYSQYVKHRSIEHVAKVDGRKTALLLFEHLYSAMSQGGTQADLDAIIARIAHIDPDLHLYVYPKEANTSDTLLQRAFQGEQQVHIHHDEYISYYLPLPTQQSCLRCHTGASIGDTLGAIRIDYPVAELKISLQQMINFFLLFMLLFSLSVFVLLLFNFRRYMLKPMRNFILMLDTIRQSKDIKQRVRVEERIEEIRSMQTLFNDMLDSIETQFYFDDLTGLRNRHALLEELDRHPQSLLMLIDIDRFGEFNNLYGNASGDMILKALTQMLIELLPQEAAIYRLHADEFAFLDIGSMDLKEFETLALFLLTSVTERPIALDTQSDVRISITIGISYGVDLLLPHADIALSIAKKEKKGCLIYDESMQEKLRYEQNINWGKRLSRAIEEERIVAFYQPIAHCESGEIVKYECLMRLREDNGDYISPIHFLALAKRNRLYHQLTLSVLRSAFETFSQNTHGFSVNLSVEDILSEEVKAFIFDALDRYGFGSRMVIEIVESEGIENQKEVIAFIETAKARGVKIAIDDFGTGYSNFEYLLQLKIDYIKIDGSMIKNITNDPKARMITQTIVEFAKRIGAKTIAEYVYSRSVFEAVRQMGIDYAQGYYFGQATKEPLE